MIDPMSRIRLKRLLGYRMAGSAILLAMSYFLFYQTMFPDQRFLFVASVAALILFFILEWSLLQTGTTFTIQLVVQYSLDLLLVSSLVFMTGGISSPFVFLFGLLIVAVGTQSHVLPILLVTVMACICYLTAIYGYSVWQYQVIDSQEGLHLLLQTSALFLVGGVMAAIARRHSSLEKESHQVVYRHRQLKELLDQVVSSMQEGIVILDASLNIQDSNGPARRLLDMEELPTRHPLKQIGTVPQPLLRYLASESGEGSFQCEWRTSAEICLVTASLLPGNDPAARWLLTLVDIGELRKLEKRLAEQDKLASMGRMLAMLAHEVRNPLNTIGQSVELMKEVGESRQGEIQEIVSEEIGRLNRLVSDMLDFVQPLTPEPVSALARDLIGSSVVQVDMTGEHGIRWSSGIEAFVIDPDHFRLVLDNLLRNAVEASQVAGTVEIELEEKSGNWEMRISDQGGGISNMMKEHLYEPFATGRASGIGLGLATVWQVCRANDWQIEAADIPGGTCFTVRGVLTTTLDGVESDG